MTQLTYSSGFLMTGVANIDFQIEFNYDSMKGGSTETTKGFEYSETLTIEAEPFMKTTVSMYVMRHEDAVIPFEALVRCNSIRCII